MSVFWAFPLQHYAYMFVIFLGAAIAARTRIHVRVEAFDFLLEKRPRPNAAVQLIARLAAFVGACLWTVASFNFAVESWQAGYRDAVLTWFPLGLVKSLSFVAGLFFIGYFGVDFVKSVRAARQQSAAVGGD
jgi:TRAP-type C4-dicarboxylate transport system permease small subunit